ncbi:unnamed protein product [Meganyctiphanes norvegica]|uniref:Testicular haploid expressed protein n=1 Tax=Meganyctiphanes norvegica TaxID=48144 RepID=A0AAV2SBE8_MEGNR
MVIIVRPSKRPPIRSAQNGPSRKYPLTLQQVERTIKEVTVRKTAQITTQKPLEKVNRCAQITMQKPPKIVSSPCERYPRNNCVLKRPPIRVSFKSAPLAPRQLNLPQLGLRPSNSSKLAVRRQISIPQLALSSTNSSQIATRPIVNVATTDYRKTVLHNFTECNDQVPSKRPPIRN